MHTETKWETIRLLAKMLDVNNEQFRKWRERDSVPARWHVPLLVESDKIGAGLKLEDFSDD
jgi:hypothetical protein